jgi:Zn finger protein HypA/HybF involved in hydrogenase expression
MPTVIAVRRPTWHKKHGLRHLAANKLFLNRFRSRSTFLRGENLNLSIIRPVFKCATCIKHQVGKFAIGCESKIFKKGEKIDNIKSNLYSCWTME